MSQSHDKGAFEGASLFVASADGFADAARARFFRDEAQSSTSCDVCDAVLDGEPAGRGLLVWASGDETGMGERVEEPPLCERCATALGVSALRQFRIEEEEEG
jgi:hypothetical protein